MSAHPALYKACEYFNVKLIKLPICARTLQLTPDIVRPHISTLRTSRCWLPCLHSSLGKPFGRQAA